MKGNVQKIQNQNLWIKDLSILTDNWRFDLHTCFINKKVNLFVKMLVSQSIFNFDIPIVWDLNIDLHIS